MLFYFFSCLFKWNFLSDFLQLSAVSVLPTFLLFFALQYSVCFPFSKDMCFKNWVLMCLWTFFSICLFLICFLIMWLSMTSNVSKKVELLFSIIISVKLKKKSDVKYYRYIYICIYAIYNVFTISIFFWEFFYFLLFLWLWVCTLEMPKLRQICFFLGKRVINSKEFLSFTLTPVASLGKLSLKSEGKAL